MANKVKTPAYRGMIVGVWVSTYKDKPTLIVETEDGKTYTAKCKQVWPGDKAWETEAPTSRTMQ